MSKKASDIQIHQDREDSHMISKTNPVFQARPKNKPVGKDCVSSLLHQKEVRQSSENEVGISQECVVSKSELSPKPPEEKRVKKIYRSEKVIKDRKADAQLKAEVKVHVTFLNKEALQNSRSLKETQDKVMTTKNKLQQQQQQQQQQPRDNIIPQRNSSPENQRHATSIDTDVPSSTTNDFTTKEQNNTTQSSISSSYHSSTASNTSKSRSIFDSFCPNLFLENPVHHSKNLPPQKSNRISKKVQNSANEQKQRQTAFIGVTIESQNEAAEMVRKFQSKSISDVEGRHQTKPALKHGETTNTDNTEVLASPAVKTTNRVSGNALLSSSPSSSSKSDKAFKKFHNSKETQLAVSTTTSNAGIHQNEAKYDSEKSEELKPSQNVSMFEIRNKAKSKISPKSIKCFKQNSSNITRKFLKKFERNSKHDMQKNKKKKHLLLKMKSPTKCRTGDLKSLALKNSNNNNNISNNDLKQKLESHKKSRTGFPEDPVVADDDDSNAKEDDESVEGWNQNHGDYDSDETDICDYDNHLNTEEHAKTRRHRLESSKPENEFQLEEEQQEEEEEEEEEEEKSDSRSELGSEGSYDTTDEDLKTRRLAVLSLLPTKTSQHQLPDKTADTALHNGDDKDRGVSINSLSLTDSILKLGGKRVNEDFLSEMECVKKKQRKNQKMESSELNDDSKKKHWLRHRNKVYFESELNELKTCKRLSLIEAKAKGLLTAINGRPVNDECSDSNNSPRLHNKGEIVNDEIHSKEKQQKRQAKQKGKQKHASSPNDQNEESNSRSEHSDGKLPSVKKDLSEDDKSCEWLIVEEAKKEREVDAGEVRCDSNSSHLKVKRLKKHSKLEKMPHSNGNELEKKADKNEPGRVGRKRKKVSEDGAEDLKESFALSRELGPKFNWLEHKIQQNYKTDSTILEVDVPSTPKSTAGIEPGVGALPSVSVAEGQCEKRSKMSENESQRQEKKPKTSSSDQFEDHLDELLPSAKHAFARNLSKYPQQNDLTPASQKEGKSSTKSTKRDSGLDDVQNLADKPEIGATNGIYSVDSSSTSNPPPATTTTQKAPEPSNLIDLTSDNPADQMILRPSFTKSFPRERLYGPYYQNHLNELPFDPADQMLRKVTDGQTKFRTMSPSFEFSDPILLHEYRQKFDNYVRVKQISDAKQREMIKLDMEKEKLKREMIVLLNMQNKLSTGQPTHGQPRTGKIPIPIPSPPSVHATKLLSKSGLTSPPPFLPVVGMSSFPPEDVNLRLDHMASLAHKYGGRRFFPPDFQAPHERLPRDGRMDYLPQSSSVRPDESNHSHLEAAHLPGGIPPRKSMPVALDDIGHDFPLANQTEQSFNDGRLNGLKMSSNRCSDVTYIKDLTMAKPLTSQTLKMCYSVHKEFLEQWAGQKLTPNYKSPQILLQHTLPTSDKLHLSDKQNRSASPTGISSSPDVIITNASIKTPKAHQGMKHFEPIKDSGHNLLQELFSPKQKQTQPLRNSPPISSVQLTISEPMRLPAQETKECSTDSEKEDQSSKLALDLSMKPLANVSQGQAKEGEVQCRSSEVLGPAEVNHGTHVLDLSTPLNLKVHYHRGDHDFSENQSSLVGRPEQYASISKSQSNLDELHIQNKPSMPSSPSLQQLSEAEIQNVNEPAVAPDAPSHFPEWTDDKNYEEKPDINPVTIEQVENKSVPKFDKVEPYDATDKKFESISDASLTATEEFDVKQTEDADEKDDFIKHSEDTIEKTVPISPAEKIKHPMTDDADDKKHPVVLRLSSERPNSCGDLLHPKMEASFSPMIEIRSRSANTPLVALNFSKVSKMERNEISPNASDNSYSDLSTKKECPLNASDNSYSDLSTKKECPLNQALEISTDSAEKLNDDRPNPLVLKECETYCEEHLLNLSMKSKPVASSFSSPHQSSTFERPSSKLAADEQSQAYLSDKHDTRASAKAGPVNDDELISKSSMMMMMMMMSQTTKAMEGKPEILNLDSEKFNAHLDDTIKKELQNADKEGGVSDSIDLSSSKLTSKGLERGNSSKTANSQQGKCSSEVRKSLEEAGLQRPKATTKSTSPLSQVVVPWEEQASSYPLRHSTDILQKEHSGRSQPSPAQYYRHHQSTMQQTAMGIPPPLPQPSPTHHSSVQQHQRQHQQFQHPKQQSQQKMLHLQQQQQPQVQQLLLRQQQLEQLQRSRRSSSPVRTRHISPPTGHKHSKPYSRAEIDHMNMADLKIGNTLANGVEKFVMVDQTLRKSVPQLDGHSKRQYPGDNSSDGSQLSYYTQLQQQSQSRPQNMQLNYQQMQQHAYGVQPPIRPYSPPPLRPPNSQRLHDLQLQQLELRRHHQQKGLKYPIPVHPQNSQLVHQLSSATGQDPHEPQAYVKPLVPQAQTSTYQQSPSRYKSQATNYPHEVRGFQNLPGVSPKDGLSPTGFSNVPIKRRQEPMDQQQYHAKHSMVPKHLAEVSKHDHPLLKSYQNEAESYWYYRQPTGRFDPSLVHGDRLSGHPKPLNEPTTSRVYDHNFRPGLASGIDLRNIPLRGGPSSSPHIPMGGVGSSRDAIGMPNNLVEEHYCFNCYKPAHFICSTCKKVSYCCKDCQAESWEKGHKDECR